MKATAKREALIAFFQTNGSTLEQSESHADAILSDTGVFLQMLGGILFEQAEGNEKLDLWAMPTQEVPESDPQEDAHGYSRSDLLFGDNWS